MTRLHLQMPAHFAAALGTIRPCLSGAAALVLAAMVSGCAAPEGPDASHKLLQADALGQPTELKWPSQTWWSVYGDQQLDDLVQQALRGSPSMATVQARLQQAQAWVDIANANRQPQVDLGFDMSDQRFTRNGLFPPPLGGGIFWNNNLQASLDYQIDLFGRQRAALEASIGRLHATQADAQSARMVLTSSVVSAYFSLAHWVEARDIALKMRELRTQFQDLVGQRQRAGLDSSVELRLAQAALAQTEVDLTNVDEALNHARHALAELTAQAPQALEALSPHLSATPQFHGPAVVPSNLVGHRPDVSAQRWRVEAALHDVDGARAEFYPNVDLQAFAGLSSLSLSTFLKSGSETYGIGPALSLPLFDGGRLRANLGVKRAELDAAIDAYNASVLRALREVADELGSLRALSAQQQAQTQAINAVRAGYSLAEQRFQAGLGNQLNVALAQFAVLAQNRAAIDLKARQLASEVALQRALGGGFQAETLTSAKADSPTATPAAH